MIRPPWAKVEAGKVIVEHDIAGPYPMLIPVGEVVLKVNGLVQREAIAVRKEDKIELSVVSELTDGKWTLRVSPDGLAARLRVEPRKGIRRSIPDYDPAPHLIIRATEAKISEPPLTMDELAIVLRQEGIVHGINLAAFAELAQLEAPAEIVIAKGTPPIPGKHADSDVCFETETTALKEIDVEADIDFRERFDFTAVSPGSILVKLVPPIPGVPGKGVRGETIPAPEPRNIELVPGEGVMLQDWANQLVATKAGRPVLRKTHSAIRVDVLPDIVIKGNVDMSTGNVSFVGDVSVLGDVTSGFSVHAGGIIRIGGVVENAVLQACGSVSVAGNLIASQVSAGLPPTFLKTISPVISDVQDMLQELAATTPLLKQRVPATKKSLWPQLLNTLVVQKSPDLYDRVRVLKVEFTKLPQRLREVLGSTTLDVFNAFLTEFDTGSTTDENLANLHKMLVELSERLNNKDTAEAFAIAKNVINSNLSAAGQISIIGGGCYNSRLQAGGKVIVNGVFRGGELRSGGDVTVKELGSESSVLTHIYCPTTALVSIGKAHENTSVIIGPRRYNFDSTQYAVKIRIIDGELIVRK